MAQGACKDQRTVLGSQFFPSTVWNRTQMVRLGGQCLTLLSHLTSLDKYFMRKQIKSWVVELKRITGPMLLNLKNLQSVLDVYKLEKPQ